ncbi:hypothetical protein E3N88_23025 [Mikania micrantha]|uniref:Uncharacterized protein n=1 Tax=Mikania micrantha TaxID=192012 RepID=A0A5N6NCC3_9ASTR|nr:hypothetical protein E3N88_23025 [Mikania micrantha]
MLVRSKVLSDFRYVYPCCPQTSMSVVISFLYYKSTQLQSLLEDYPQKSLSLSSEAAEENLRKTLFFRSFMSSEALKL